MHAQQQQIVGEVHKTRVYMPRAANNTCFCCTSRTQLVRDSLQACATTVSPPIALRGAASLLECRSRILRLLLGVLPTHLACIPRITMMTHCQLHCSNYKLTGGTEMLAWHKLQYMHDMLISL